MGETPHGPALKFAPNQKQIIRKMYDLDKPQRLKETLDLMRHWIEKQQHFRKKDFSDEYLERLILTNKGSVEKAKVRLDKLCTLKSLWTDFFASIDVHSCKKYFKDFNILALPEPTEDWCRVLIFKIFPASPIYPDLATEVLKYSVVTGEYFKIKEYVDGFILILDVMNCGMIELLAVSTLNSLRRARVLFEGYGLRMKHMHIMTTSNMTDTLVKLGKQVMGKKLGERIDGHTSFDSLHKFISKEILPYEYGGNAGPMERINDNLYRELCTEEYTEYLKEMIAASTDESKRPKDTFNETYVNMPGAFRTLILD